jgi:hypothetical protein
MLFEKSVIELIKYRTSQRSYTSEKFSDEMSEKIDLILKSNTIGAMGNTVKFHLIEKSFNSDNQKVKLGTYGFIKGAHYFIAGVLKKQEFDHEDYGYLLEKIVLHLTDLNLGTCWIGGTFSRSEFSQLIKVGKDEFIPAETPVGFTTERRSLRDNIIRWSAGSKNRKPWNELFFDSTFDHPLTEANADNYAFPLEMVRLAPSASNKQPWRILKQNGQFHFFLQRTAGYDKIIKSVDLQRVDIGIAMSHFELTAKELKITGSWKILENSFPKTENLQYVVTWTD